MELLREGGLNEVIFLEDQSIVNIEHERNTFGEVD